MIMKRVLGVVCLALFAVGGPAAAEVCVAESEGFGGEKIAAGYDRGVSYVQPGKAEATAQVKIAAGGRYQVYARVFFTWANREHLLLKIAGQELVIGNNVRRPFRWDVGNYQVWHWIKAGDLVLPAGEQPITLTGPGRLDRLVFYRDNEPAWSQPWLAGATAEVAGAALEIKSGGMFASKRRDIVFDAAEWRTTGGARPKMLPDGRVCLLQAPGDAALRRFRLPKAGKFQVWARYYFYNKNMFDGRTMEEMQHSTYLAVDGCVLGTVMEQNRRRWTWHELGTIDLDAGEHLLAVSQRGGPVLVGEVVLKRSEKAVEACDWYAAPRSAVVPFNIPGGVDPVAAQRAGQWLLLGPLGADSRGEWLGEQVEGKSQPVAVRLPNRPGLLVMEPSLPIECSPAIRPQIVGFYCRGDIDGLRFRMAILDRNGDSWLTPCQAVAADDEWTYVYAFLAPAMRLGGDALARGDSGRTPAAIEPGGQFASPRLALQAERQPMPAQWGTLELTHLLIDSTTAQRRTIQIAEPAFQDPLEAGAKATATDGWVQLGIDLKNSFPHRLQAELHARIGPLGENISDKEAARRWRRFVIPVDGAQDRNAVISLPLPRGGAHLVSYRLGLGPVKRLRVLSDAAAKPLLERELARARQENCAYEDPAWRRQVARGDVAKRYGKDFRLTVDGLDVTSLEYAERHQSLKPFRVEGRDLSDAAGWPEIHAAPGTIFYDPPLGRIKFAEGYAGPCEVVGSYPTGFGVPGGGPPSFFGNYALTPGGEGNYSVFDISRDDRPLPPARIPSWYFEHDGHKLGNFLFFNSSHRGLTMIDDLSNPTRPGVLRRVELDVERWGRVRAIDEELRLMLSSGGDGIGIFSLEDPLRPRLRALATGCFYPLPTGVAGRFLTRTKEGLALLDITNAANPKQAFTWSYPDGEEAWAKVRILSVSPDRIAVRLPDTQMVVEKRKQKRASIACWRYAAGRGVSVIGEPCTDLPAARAIRAAFHGDYLYLLNGQRGPGQYGVSTRTKPSEWHTYRVGDNSLQRVGEPLVDEYPSVYSQIRIRGNRAYVTDYNIGMWVFDLADPAHPKKAARYYGAAEGDALYVNNAQAYFWQTFGGQVFLIDCKQPAAPVCRSVYWDGSWVGYQNRFRGSNTIWGKDDVFYSPRSGKGLAIIDASNPANPRQVGLVEPPNGIYGRCDFRVRGDVLAVTQVESFQVAKRKRESKRMVRFHDVSDPRKPQVLGEIAAKAGSAVYWRGQLLYLAEGQWLSIIDASDPKQPKVLSETDLKAAVAGFEGANVCGIAVGDGIAHLTVRAPAKETALMLLIDVADPRKPRFVRLFDSLSDYMSTECSETWANFYQDCVIRDGMLIIGSYGRIECFDVTDPLLPRFVAQKELGFHWSVGMLEGDYLYVPGLAEFILLKVPANPQRPLGKLQVE